MTSSVGSSTSTVTSAGQPLDIQGNTLENSLHSKLQSRAKVWGLCTAQSVFMLYSLFKN